MKKRILALLMAAVVVCSLAACGKKAAPAPVPSPAPEPSPAPVESQPVVPAPTEESAPAKAEEQAPAEAQPVQTDAVNLENVREKMLEELNIFDPFLLDTEALTNLYGIAADQVAQSASFVTMDGTFPDEIILVEAVDEAAAAAVQELLQRRLDEVMVQSKSYDPENYAAAQACKVRIGGTFVSLILSPKQEALAEIYEELVK